MILLGSREKIVTVVLVSIVFLGCAYDDTTSELVGDQSGDTASTVGSASAPSDSDGTTVTIADRAAYDELIASHNGKVVLVDFWATWCLPCVKQFPHTVELSRQIDPSKLAVVSVSMDEPEDQEKVLKFLRGSGASFDNLISKYGVGQEGFDAFEITDGAIPHYKIYDRTGQLQHTAGSNDEIDDVIAQLLDEA